MKVYIAATYSRRKEMLGYAEQLKEGGCTVTSRWIDQEEELAMLPDTTVAEHGAYATKCLIDLANADLLICFTDQPSSTGGYHVELGLALGNGLDVWLCGPRLNVFHCLPEVRQFNIWPEVLQEIADRRRQR